MLSFSDILYGSVQVPEWLGPFLKLPEFVRLRGVRLSNVDSYQFKDFNGPTRWEHCIAVAWLALRCADRKRLSERDRVHLALAALLHDVATPPFAHTAEYVLEGFDHEAESQNLVSSRSDEDFLPDLPVFASQLPQFYRLCKQTSARLGFAIDPDAVAEMVVGDGELGFLVHGSVDLDNADNVTRACRYLGVAVDPTIPPRVAEWLAEQDHVPTDLEHQRNPAVREWLRYRGELYSRFFESSDEEMGRQAFLQHLMRRALDEGLPRRRLIWNTDERLLFDMESIGNPSSCPDAASLGELVQRYRLLEAPEKIVHIEIDSPEILKVLRLPQAVAWMERHLTTETFEPFVMVSSIRHARVGRTSLFPPPAGTLFIFKLGEPPKRQQLPEWLRQHVGDRSDGPLKRTELSRAVHREIDGWLKERPWMTATAERRVHVIQNLDGLGNWSFRLSRNESLHPYPGTFVHAIPAGLIASLGVQGELVVDPFGGTGQTALEVVKYGGTAVSGDINSIACLAARAKLTFLDKEARRRLRSIGANELRKSPPGEIPEFELREKWFDPDTLKELLRIRRFIETRRNADSQQFLLACLSAIVTSCTGRKGKEHGFFADNTPLEKGQSKPPYQNAIELFLRRAEKSLNSLERLYASFERDGRDPKEALARATVVHADATKAVAEDYGVSPGTVAAIVTSPPYLCMADYCLGQRLSYQVAMPDRFASDFAAELGARRHRFRREAALERYRGGLRSFARLTSTMLRPGGFLATVVGNPSAAAFSGLDLIAEFDALLEESGFERMWFQWRPISWHRNHGYARLKQERIAVHVRATSK